MTPAERIALIYLSGVMEATAPMIGRRIYDAGYALGSNLQGIGSNAIGRLRKRGYISRVTELNAWQITREGRAALNS